MTRSFSKFVLFFLVILNILAFSACHNDPEGNMGDEYADSLGNKFFVSGAPSRVAVLFSSLADMWSTAGGDIYITVGESIERGFAAEDTLLVDTGAGKRISTELLISYKPDFVIYSADIDAQVEAAKILSMAGITTAGFRVENFSDYLSVLDVMTDITGNKEAYRLHGLEVKEKIDLLLNSTKNKEKIDILFIRASTSAKSTKAKTGRDHFVAAMLDELGCVNIADSAPILLDGLSIEAVIDKNPDMIFISTMGDEASVRSYMDTLLKSSAWQALDAVREGRFYYLSKELSQFKPNSRWYEAYAMLAEILYEKEN